MDSKDRAIDIETNFKKVKKKVWDHARDETQSVLNKEQKSINSLPNRRE